MKPDIYEAGVDEVGRGCLAGPVVAAAVILPNDFDNPLIMDSKKLKESKHHEAVGIIQENALAYGVAFIDNNRVDEINILQATFEAMHNAINKMEKQFNIGTDHLLIDGDKFKPYYGVPHTTVVKGDGTYYSIAAASILAKYTRDKWMASLGESHQEYDWASNKGYGTKKHREAILEHGITHYHRKTFLGNILQTNTNKLF